MLLTFAKHAAVKLNSIRDIETVSIRGTSRASVCSMYEVLRC